MTNKMNPVVHFEMPYEDRDRMVEFYAKAFGWQLQKLGEDMGNYVLAMTAETDEKTQRPKEPGTINGGFFQKQPDNNALSVVISVPDIKAAMEKIKAAGGTLLGGDPVSDDPEKPGDIPGIGLYMRFSDTEGNRNSLLQPEEMKN